jgi:cytochrome c
MKNSRFKSSIAYCVFVAAALTCMSSTAMANEDLAEQKDCFSCHSTDVRSIGPSYKDVSARYAGRQDAVAALTKKVMQGGSGAWGKKRMPANENVNEAEARELVEWVLSLKN